MEGSAQQSVRGAKSTRGHGRRRDAVRARKKKIPGAPLGAALAQHPIVEQCAEGCNGQCEQWRRSAADVVCGAGMPKLRAASIAQLHGASCGVECVRRWCCAQRQ